VEPDVLLLGVLLAGREGEGLVDADGEGDGV